MVECRSPYISTNNLVFIPEVAGATLTAERFASSSENENANAEQKFTPADTVTGKATGVVMIGQYYLFSTSSSHLCTKEKKNKGLDILDSGLPKAEFL